MERSKQSYLYAGLAILFWSTIPTAFKISIRELPIVSVITIASVTSALVLFLILVLTGNTGQLKMTSGKDLRSSAIMGLINPFIYYLILLRAYSLLPAQVAQPLNMIWPIVLVFLSVIILHQKITRKSYLALLISFAGVYIISSQGNPLKPGHADPEGVMLALVSSVFWALYFILNMKDKRDGAVKLFMNFVFASLYLVAAMIITGQWNSEYTTTGVLASVYLGIFEMGVTFFLWLKALSTAPSTDRVSNLVYIGPFISLIFVHFILHEPVYYTTPAGLLLIISGIFVQSRKGL
jgi:drug/metabolite transporter (DMT)-like permease